jgi:hypothetical protein
MARLWEYNGESRKVEGVWSNRLSWVVLLGITPKQISKQFHSNSLERR